MHAYIYTSHISTYMQEYIHPYISTHMHHTCKCQHLHASKQQAEASDNSRQISTTKNTPLSARQRTTASVDWVMSETWKWREEEQESIDISPVVYEVMNRPGWRAGNALMLILRQRRVSNTLTGCEVRFSDPVYFLIFFLVCVSCIQMRVCVYINVCMCVYCMCMCVYA